MLSTDPEYNRRLWEAALRSAAGPVSAYISPATFGLSVFHLSAEDSQGDAFLSEIHARIDFGRALEITEALDQATRELTSGYSHSLAYCKGRIDGKIHVPRLILERSNGGRRGVPVLRAARHLQTPENLMASELLLSAIRVARFWASREGAEGALAAKMLTRLQALESKHPWTEFKTVPREHLSSLASSVKGRVRAGWCLPSSAMARLAELAAPNDISDSLRSAAGPLSYLGVQDGRFGDKLFELLCLGWIVSTLTSLFRTRSIRPAGIRNSSIAIWQGESRNSELMLYFQAGFVSKDAVWKWVTSNKALRAIPDFVLVVRTGTHMTLIVIDAKNRSASSDSEVVYKMLGYKENLRFDPYLGVALFPEFESEAVLSAVAFGAHKVVLARIPLELRVNSRAFIRLAAQIGRNLVGSKRRLLSNTWDVTPSDADQAVLPSQSQSE